jgi:micrococcal nuclease
MTLHWSAIVGTGAFAAIILVNQRPTLIALPQQPTSERCRAIDGDTLDCSGGRVRLLGIDAAELPGHCAPRRNCAPGDAWQQRERLSAFVDGPMQVRQISRDRYGRRIAVVTNLSGKNASCAMLVAGATYREDWDDRYITAGACVLELGRTQWAPPF